MWESERDQRGAAYHEAGHAVVAWALGLVVRRVEIAVDSDDAKGAAEIEDDPTLDLLDRLAICAAGREAQKLFDAPTHDGAGWGDYGKMVVLLANREEKRQIEWMHRGHKRAFDLISLHRGKIDRLAKTVIEKKRVEADESAALLAD